MANSPNTDGQIGMEDIVINDPDMYKAVKRCCDISGIVKTWLWAS